MAVQSIAKRHTSDKKGMTPPAQKPFSASGTVVGKISSVEFKVWGKSQKEFCNVTLLLPGGIQFRAIGKSESVLQSLDRLMEGDEVGLFGVYESRIVEDTDSKIFSDFTILKVDTDRITTHPRVTIFGKFIQQVGISNGCYVDVDVTSKEAYPGFVRIKVPSDVTVPELQLDDLVKAFCYPVGKFGEMTVQAFKDPLATESFDSTPPVGDMAKLSRFKRTGTPTVQGDSGEPVPGKSAGYGGRSRF